MKPKTELVVRTVLAVALVWWLAGSAVAVEKEVSLVTKKPIGELAVAGRLSIDLHAEFMVSRTYEKDTVLNWYDCGYSGGGRTTKVGGNFGDFGFQVPLQEREEKYPHAVTVGNVRAVRFDGGDFLKGNFEVEKKIAGAQNMALEIWLRADNPAKGEGILGWQSPDGRETSAPVGFPAKFKGSEQWRHIVVNCTPTKEDWYLDGAKVSSGKRILIVQEGHILVLGGVSVAKPSFKGDLAAVRLHDEAMTEEEITHNFKGGVMLGTEMHSWWRNEPDKWFVVESEHFRHCVDKQEMAKWPEKRMKEFKDRIPLMFHMAELVYHTYSERLAMRSSVVSRRPEKRGDGIKYKTPIQPANGSWMGVDDDFGWACQGEGHINPHELAHGWDAMTGGMAGNYWETHANFPQTYNGIYQTIPLVVSEGPSFPSSGRTYYHDRLMFEHLAQTPEYGPMFIAKMWYDGPTPTDKDPYPWQTFTRINPNPSTLLGYQWTRMVQKMVTWDYTTFAEGQPGKGNTPHGNDGVAKTNNLYQKVANDSIADIRRFARIVLEQIPLEPEWWRVPKEQAPQQLGWNICPLKFQPGTVSVTLAGYVNPARGSDWRAGFVGVDQSGKPVYGDIFGPGKLQSFQAGANLKELYLVVCAVPTNIIAINMTGDFRSFEQEPFPYKVKLAGCTPFDALVLESSTAEGAQHPNGGGFVAKSAKVEPGAYVGPKARVLGNSKLLGQARIEDQAVVRDATVKDEAVVSGHALVREEAVIAGHARVRDYAVIKARSTVQDNARILEHATLASRKTCGGDVVVKGIANVYGGNQAGTAMLDGFYAKGNEITNGRWFTWSWGQGRNPGEQNTDFGGLYADYDFEKEHPWMAADAFGATWGYLVNSPKFEIVAERAKTKSGLTKPEAILPKLEAQGSRGQYVQLLSGYLLPPLTGDYTLWVQADDEGEMWLGEAGSAKADRKLCSNPFWAGFHDFQKFPTQKSAVVRLEKGKSYPLTVLLGNSHEAGSVSVAWTKPGSTKPEVIGGENLSVTPDGKQPGVRQRIWGGISKVADLLKRADYPEGVVREGGQVLVLNGKNQFIELPKDVADMRNCTYTAEFKWTGGEIGARLFEFANPNGDVVWLCPSENGKLVFAIRHGMKVEQLSAPAVQPNVWTTVRVIMDGQHATLHVDGKKVAENNAMALTPESVRATQCYLGRGLKSGHFGGMIDRFTIHSVALMENTQPR